MNELTALVLISAGLSTQDEPRPPRAEVGRMLSAALDAEKSARTTEETVPRLLPLQTAAADAARALPPASLIAEQVRAHASAQFADDEVVRRQQLATLRARLARIAADLGFEPTRQAPVPEGWPAPAPVGDVVVKDYPAYRMARSTLRGGGEIGAFWTLFQHIQANDIPMTAPVQMDYGPGNGHAPAERLAMAFLYESTERGRLSAQGKVEVVDVPAATWVSIGARGYETTDTVDDLLADLRRWLAAHASRYEIGGPMRVMGWNSPSVRAERRFYEVELPVRLRRDV
jgi:hypothetical protein